MDAGRKQSVIRSKRKYLFFSFWISLIPAFLRTWYCSRTKRYYCPLFASSINGVSITSAEYFGHPNEAIRDKIEARVSFFWISLIPACFCTCHRCGSKRYYCPRSSSPMNDVPRRLWYISFVANLCLYVWEYVFILTDRLLIVSLFSVPTQLKLLDFIRHPMIWLHPNFSFEFIHNSTQQLFFIQSSLSS